jgi:hypothetical protein
MLNIFFISGLCLALTVIMVDSTDQSNYFIDIIFLMVLILSLPSVILILLVTSFILLVIDIIKGNP